MPTALSSLYMNADERLVKADPEEAGCEDVDWLIGSSVGRETPMNLRVPQKVRNFLT
jgi:hypothetical protein